MNTVTVPVTSSWASKINWTQAVSALAMLLAWYSGGKISMTADQQVALVTSIGVITNIVTWVLRTWFTKTVTPSSIPAATPVVRQTGTQ
jgi:hypothetical protein